MKDFQINIPKEPDWQYELKEPFGGLINGALEPHLPVFRQLMLAEHTRYWQNIHDRLDYARSHCAQLDDRLDTLYSLNIGEEVTPEIRSIEKVRRPLVTILRSVAADYGQLDRYLAHIQPRFDDDLFRNVAMLSMRCEREGFDPDKLQVSCVSVKANSLALDFNAGRGKGFEALFSYSKGSSILRLPHMRCIIGERSHRRQQVAARTVMPESHGQTLEDRLVRTLQSVRNDFTDIFVLAHTDYYKKLWEKLPYARERYTALQAEIAAAGRLGRSASAKSLKRVASGFGNLVNSEAAGHLTCDSYIRHALSQWDSQLVRAASLIAQKCVDKGMDDAYTKVLEMLLDGGCLNLRLKDDAHEIRAYFSLYSGGGVQHPPQMKTSVGETIAFERQQQASSQRKLPGLGDVPAPSIDRQTALPHGLVTHTKIVEYKDKLFLSCHIAGVRQSPVRIQPDEWKRYLAQAGNDKTGLVIAHFPQQIQRALAGQSVPEAVSHTLNNKR